jgi:hypothetical protein
MRLQLSQRHDDLLIEMLREHRPDAALYKKKRKEKRKKKKNNKKKLKFQKIYETYLLQIIHRMQKRSICWEVLRL